MSPIDRLKEENYVKLNEFKEGHLLTHKDLNKLVEAIEQLQNEIKKIEGELVPYKSVHNPHT
jgi:DNA mismatch repair ATPase MutS